MRVRNLILALCFLGTIGAVQQGQSTRPFIPLRVLGSGDLAPLTAAFNDDVDKTRILLLVSPT